MAIPTTLVTALSVPRLTRPPQISRLFEEELDATAGINDARHPFSNSSRALAGFNVLVALDEKPQWARILQHLRRHEN